MTETREPQAHVPDLSVVIPLYDEYDNVAPLLAALRRARGVDRSAVYRWLADTLGRPRERTHVALFDAPTCAAMIRQVEHALAEHAGTQ